MIDVLGWLLVGGLVVGAVLWVRAVRRLSRDCVAYIESRGRRS